MKKITFSELIKSIKREKNDNDIENHSYTCRSTKGITTVIELNGIVVVIELRFDNKTVNFFRMGKS